MKLSIKEKNTVFKKSDVVAVFLSEDYSKDSKLEIPSRLSSLRDTVDFSFFKGKSREVMFLPFKDLPGIIIIGIGKKKEIEKDDIRNFASKIVRVCKTRKIEEVHIILPSIGEMDESDILVGIAEGVYLSNYNINRYKTNKNNDKQILIKRAFFITGLKNSAKKLKEIEIVCNNTKLCRDLVNESSEKANPRAIARIAKGLSKFDGVSCTVFGKAQIQKMKMGLLLAVARGSKIPPQFVVLKYRGKPAGKKETVIVGKGITFDSGGINLKSTAGIAGMRQDMAGAAAALYALKAIAELKLKKNVTALIPLCENMIASDAYRPGDVFTSYSGKSVEVGNTDAEGRLILADALAYAEKNLKPNYVIDIATLTGACLVCFGEIVAGLVSTNDDLAGRIHDAGEATGDRVWRLPLYRDYDEGMKSDIADIKNVGANRHAGTIMGGVFLKSFVKDTPWAHIDIAGTAWFSKQRGYRPKYATGFGVRLFVELVRSL